MFKSEIKILIIEDDKKLGETLKSLIEDLAYKVELFHKPSDVLSYIQHQSFHLLICDIMLPQKNGVDLVQEIRNSGFESVPVILMSGIYKDNKFIQNAIKKTSAAEFLTKPFDADKLIEIIDNLFADTVEPDLTAWDKVFSSPNITNAEILAAISNENSIHGLELPFILFKHLNHHINGTITLTNNENNDISTIRIANHKITSVLVQDPKSFFGQLLVEKNFCSAEDLEYALNLSGDKRVGEKLIDNNLLSPHAIDIVNSEQMAIRLSHIVGNYNYSFKFQTNATETKVLSGIDKNILTSFTCDWLYSKFNSDWLANYFSKWMDSKIILKSEFNTHHPILFTELFMRNKNIVPLLVNNATIHSLIESSNLDEDTILQLCYLLLCHDLFYFEFSSSAKDLVSFEKRIVRLLSKSQDQDYFQILGISRGATDDDVKEAFKELAKVYHPDKLPKDVNENLKNLTDKFFAKLSKAHEVLSHPNERQNYLQELNQGQAKLRLKAEALLEEAKEQLKMQSYIKADSMLQEAIELCPPTPEIMLHHMWATMKASQNGLQLSKKLDDITKLLTKIPPEDRHNSTYYFVKGLHQKHLGQLELAQRNIKHALQLDSKFIEAQRELNIINLSGNNEKKDILNADLRDVVGMLFKKKK